MKDVLSKIWDLILECLALLLLLITLPILGVLQIGELIFGKPKSDKTPLEIIDTRNDDELLKEALKYLKERKFSTSFLQWKLKIGYAKASSLIDILKEKGYIKK